MMMGIKRDWKKKEDYEFTENLELERWAWEFLRRNEDYINEWKKLSNFYLRLKVAKREDFDDPKFRIKLPGYSQKWGLKYGFLNPEQDNPYQLGFLKTRAKLEVKLNYKEPYEHSISTAQIEKILKGDLGEGVFYAKSVFEPKRFNFPIKFYYDKNDVVAFFDLSLPIPSQLKKITEVLEQTHDKKVEKGDIEEFPITRKHKDKWIEYLRVLDAKKEGLSNKEIAKVLYPNEENTLNNDHMPSRWVRDNNDQANNLVNEGYKKILL